MASLFTFMVLHAVLLIQAGAQPALHGSCRFSHSYSFADIVRGNPQLENDIFFWESQFHQNGVGYNVVNGMTFDGCTLDSVTGLASPQEEDRSSTASNEALQIMVYTHAILENNLASTFVYPWHTIAAPQYAAAMLVEKLQTYQHFNSTFPGYGGLLPHFISSDTTIRATPGWENRISAGENGQLLWAVYGLVAALDKSERPEFKQLAASWQNWLDLVSQHISKMFYRERGQVCSIVALNQDLLPSDARQDYSCSDKTRLNDPFEGELFTWWLYFYGGLSWTDKRSLWDAKRPQLRAVNYTGSTVYTNPGSQASTNYANSSVQPPSIVPITVQQGHWFSSYEQLKLLVMPYLDIDIVNRVFKNAERVRTCNSKIMGATAGMFASVGITTNTTTGLSESYISNAGIPSVARDQDQRLDVITPYSVFPTILFDKVAGLIWYKNMLDARGMQNPYGSTESLRRNGSKISALVSWQSKVTTIVALLGGIGDIVRDKMVADNIYDNFTTVLDYEYGLVFGEHGYSPIVGEDVEICLPDATVPISDVADFTMCS